MTLGSLFAGIGGFELAATWAGITPVWSNEIEPFACKVLTKNFNHEIIQKDIREIGKHNLPAVDIISGGFPCQPFSQAGKRKGSTDDRFLWGQMLRIIKELQPSYVIGENVAGIVSMENGKILEGILTDLEAEGYNNEVFIIPACATGAWHRRDRIWIVAYSMCIRNKRLRNKLKKSGTTRQRGENNEATMQTNINITSIRPSESWNNKDREKHRAIYDGGREIEPAIRRIYDGIPNELDKGRLKGLGNAIVPQVAYELFKAIHEVDSL